MIIRDQRISLAIILVLVGVQLYQHPSMDVHAAVAAAITTLASITALFTSVPGSPPAPAPAPTPITLGAKRKEGD